MVGGHQGFLADQLLREILADEQVDEHRRHDQQRVLEPAALALGFLHALGQIHPLRLLLQLAPGGPV